MNKIDDKEPRIHSQVMRPAGQDKDCSSAEEYLFSSHCSLDLRRYSLNMSKKVFHLNIFSYFVWPNAFVIVISTFYIFSSLSIFNQSVNVSYREPS